MPEEIEKCMEAGCDGYVSKPISKIKLYDVIRQMMQ